MIARVPQGESQPVFHKKFQIHTTKIRQLFYLFQVHIIMGPDNLTYEQGSI